MHTYAMKAPYMSGEPVSNWVGIPILVLLAAVCVWALWPRKCPPLAYGRSPDALNRLIPGWLAWSGLTVIVVALAVGLVVGLRSLGKTRRALGLGWTELVRTLVEMSRREPK